MPNSKIQGYDPTKPMVDPYSPDYFGHDIVVYYGKDLLPEDQIGCIREFAGLEVSAEEIETTCYGNNSKTWMPGRFEAPAVEITISAKSKILDKFIANFADRKNETMTILYPDGRAWIFTAIITGCTSVVSADAPFGYRIRIRPTGDIRMLDGIRRVIYNLDQCTGVVPIDPTLYNVGETVTIKSNEGIVPPTGKIWISWDVYADDELIYTDTVCDGHSTFVMPETESGRITIYAHVDYPEYEFVIKPNLAEAIGIVPETTEKHKVGDIVTIPTPGTLKAASYRLICWTRQDTGAKVAFGSTIIMPARDLTLIGTWTPIYHVAYTAGDISIVDDLPHDSTDYIAGDTTTIRDLPQADGYVAHVWRDEKDNEYAPGMVISITGDMLLWPKWMQAFSVTYSANGGYGTVPVDGTLYPYGERVHILPPHDLKRDGYTFAGWIRNDVSVDTPHTQPGEFVSVTKDILLLAAWDPVIPPVPVTPPAVVGKIEEDDEEEEEENEE